MEDERMKTTTTVVLAALLNILPVNGIIIAAEKTQRPDMGAYDSDLFRCDKSEAGQTCIRGEVTAVDSKAGRLTVKAKGKDMTLAVDAKAKAAFQKTKAGDMVDVNYTEEGGKLLATSIAEVKSKRKSEKK
jgi:Cu/Ag efflux protein CusF